ncbi:hypothetical protein ACI2IP_07675 [Microbacterium sp. NPDC090218]
MSDSPADRWLRPSGDPAAEPRWGHPEGLQIGIPPLPGPRGLLRVFTPYLDHPRDRLVNFLAVEPIPQGATARGFSEMEPSSLDPGAQGKRFWSADDPLNAETSSSPTPARGRIGDVDGVETLTVWIGVERFDNGADVRVRVRFFADRPHEVEVAGFANAASVPLSHLILTATMGNWARLRVLHLADRVVTPAELWPDFSGTAFTAHGRFPLAELARDGDAAIVSATGDEEDPWSVEYSADTVEHWRFVGRRAVQTWRVDDPHPALEAVVNARWSYWASASPIPGGPAYENFEIIEPFRQGAAFRFSVEPL